ncbi:uncharacterized protein LOC111317780 [Durio zibethinus]|uniref:Uncharacterized protein LOC111317780 n=1 Tax=Durio zibethinus TaxID=66656 RepID=A0A6P6BFM3_DURZI|nr:uncharacterized protein LOC111317780 [Durio zibethinus]
MEKTEKDQFSQALTAHHNTIHETFQVFFFSFLHMYELHLGAFCAYVGLFLGYCTKMLDQTPSFSLEKVTWTEVIRIVEQLSKQATIAGMLWNGQAPEAKQLGENITSYFNVLKGFHLLSHRSTVGAGPTLSSRIHESVKQFVGAVWEACSALKKDPATNVIAIGCAITQVAVSMKDALRQVKELKPACSDLRDEASDDTPTKAQSRPEDDDLSEDDLATDSSPEEMKVAQLAQGVVSETLVTIKGT